jgi:hypothetical protein
VRRRASATAQRRRRLGTPPTPKSPHAANGCISSLALPRARGLVSIVPPSRVVVQEPCRWICSPARRRSPLSTRWSSLAVDAIIAPLTGGRALPPLHASLWEDSPGRASNWIRGESRTVGGKKLRGSRTQLPERRGTRAPSRRPPREGRGRTRDGRCGRGRRDLASPRFPPHRPFFPLVCSSLGGSTRQAGTSDGGNRGVRACGPGRVGLALWVR